MVPFRLRIPPALAVALLGGAATLTASFVSCHEEPLPPDPDAGQISFERDAGFDGHVASTGDARGGDDMPDAGVADAPDTPVG